MMRRRRGGQIFVTFLMLCHTKLYSFVIPNNDASWSGTYRCVDYGETFAASWLASVSALDGIKKYRSVLKSHRAAHASHYITWERSAHKTVDALDFFVEHLSAYERRLNIGKFRAGKFQESLRRGVTDVLGHLLRRYTLSHFHSSALEMRLSGDENRILGIIPYYGEGLGKGQAQSSLETRKVYLEATYWSIRALTPRVVIAVGTDEDAIFVEDLVNERLAPRMRTTSEYNPVPVLTLLKLKLPGPQSLPVAAVSFLIRTFSKDSAPVQRWSTVPLPRETNSESETYVGPIENDWTTHLRMASSKAELTVWEDVRYVLFSEADQIIHARKLRPDLLRMCDNMNFMVPHRFIPMPTYSDFQFHPAMMKLLGLIRDDPRLDQQVDKNGKGFQRLLQILDVNRNKSDGTQAVVYTSSNMHQQEISHCCQDRGNCSSRDHWKSYLSDEVALIRVAPTLDTRSKYSGFDRHSAPLGLAFVAGDGNVQQTPPLIRPCSLTKATGPCP